MITPPFHCRLVLCSALIAVFVLCFSAVSIHASTLPMGIRWETDLNVATARAEQEQRPLFLHFVSNDSPSARQMENEVFVLPNIANQLNANFVMVRINVSENPALAQRFSITSAPTDLILRPNGQLIHRRWGIITAELFVDYLAFLRGTIQEDRNPPPAPVASSAASSGALSAAPAAHPAAHPIASPTASPAPATGSQTAGSPAEPFPMPHQVAPPETTIDPFAPQHPAAPPHSAVPHSAPQSPAVMQQAVTAVEMPPSVPGYNPLRTGETAARMPVEQTSSLPPPFAGSNPVAVHSAEGMTTPANIPAPPKMMIEVPLALEGFCPVTLCTEERWVSGNPAYCTMYQGHIFRFATREALVRFAQEPANYIPVAMGEDIVLMVDRNKRVNGSRQLAAYCKGRIFLFASQETYDAFTQRPDYYMEIALRYETARKEPPIPLVY